MDAEDAIVCGRRIIEFCKGMYSKEPINLFLDRRTEWTEKFSLDLLVDIFPYTEKELNSNIPIALEAVKNGVTLFKR